MPRKLNSAKVRRRLTAHAIIISSDENRRTCAALFKRKFARSAEPPRSPLKLQSPLQGAGWNFSRIFYCRVSFYNAIHSVAATFTLRGGETTKLGVGGSTSGDTRRFPIRVHWRASKSCCRLPVHESKIRERQIKGRSYGSTLCRITGSVGGEPFRAPRVVNATKNIGIRMLAYLERDSPSAEGDGGEQP